MILFQLDFSEPFDLTNTARALQCLQTFQRVCSIFRSSYKAAVEEETVDYLC